MNLGPWADCLTDPQRKALRHQRRDMRLALIGCDILADLPFVAVQHDEPLTFSFQTVLPPGEWL